VVIEIDPERRQLDRDAAQARLAQAEAELLRQQRQTDRMRRLREQKISSEQQLEEEETALLLARANSEVERAAFGVAERALADASVRAPFAGSVASRSAQLGQFVQKGDALFELVSLDPLEVEFSVPELDANRLRLGLAVDVTVAALPERSFYGVVKFVSPIVDPETRTLRIRALIDNSDGLLRPGMFARVNLGVSRREGVTMVPEEAVIQRANGASLFKLLPDQRVQRVAVVTGSVDEGLVEVRGDVHPGERVVRRGPGGLTDGAVVRVLGEEPEVPAVAAGGNAGAEG
jgi:membrane fusion protein (multidrug efflux system)